MAETQLDQTMHKVPLKGNQFKNFYTCYYYLYSSSIIVFDTGTIPAITFTAECSVSIQNRSVSCAPAQVTYNMKIIGQKEVMVVGNGCIPSNAFSISSSLGIVLFLSNVYIDITIPGVQKPHCDPWAFAMRSCVYTVEHILYIPI